MLFVLALITGASSGIGKDMAEILSEMGYDLILVSRSENKLDEIKKALKTKVKIIPLDLSEDENCYKLFKEVKDDNIDFLINNAGYGLFGKFDETDLDTEMNMLRLNINAVHILTKLFYREFKKKNKGRILNVSSSAAFLPGPLLSSYYASKAYILRLSQAIYEEIRRESNNVSISVLCPGPVDTGFNDRAGVKFALKGLDSKYVAKYALKKAFKGKLVIIPGNTLKIAKFATRLFPDKVLLKFAYHTQRKKER